MQKIVIDLSKIYIDDLRLIVIDPHPKFTDKEKDMLANSYGTYSQDKRLK